MVTILSKRNVGNYCEEEVHPCPRNYEHNNEHFNGIFYDTMKRKSPQIHFYVKNDTIRSMSFVTFI